MKRITAALLILVIIIMISSLHIYKVITITNEIKDRTDVIYSLYQSDKWSGIEDEIDKISELWNRNKLWAYLTLSTNQVDEIEISLEQCKSYSQIEAKPDFIGEFRMFCMLVEHLPKQETFSLEELL